MRSGLLAFLLVAGCTTAETPALQPQAGTRVECAPLNAKSAIVHCKPVPIAAADDVSRDRAPDRR
jgi:hypothetical protein